MPELFLYLFADLTPASTVCLSLSAFAACSVPFHLTVDADLEDFDPRPAVRRATPVVRRATAVVHQSAVHAGHDLNRAAASTRHEWAPTAACVWHAAYTAREAGRDAVALLLLLTTAPKAGIR